MLFFYIFIKQGLNYSNTFPNKNNPAQAIYFITVGSPSPLLIILILTYVRNPFSLYNFPLKYLTDGILILTYVRNPFSLYTFPLKYLTDGILTN